MADGQEQPQTQQQPMSEISGVPQNLFAQMLAHQLATSDTSGLTSMQPNLQPTAPIQRPQQPMQPQQKVTGAAPGTGPMIREQRLQNLTNSVSNLANQIGQQVQAKKNREYTQVVGQFVSLTKGINDAKSQLQQGQQLVQQAQQEQDPQRKAQMQQQGQQMVQTAQQALQQNMANYNDIVNDPKKHKVITKAFGIDDKNANTPERQAAIKAIQQQNQGMSQQGANVMSRMPQTQQLSPQAQAQSQAVQAGVMGRPRPTTLTEQMNAAAKFEQLAQKGEELGLKKDQIDLRAYKQELVPVTDAKEGEPHFRPMTNDERTIYGMATKGVVAWTTGADGKVVSVLRNPKTNQIIPGTENPAILPPSYLTEHVHTGEFTYTDSQNNVYRVPTTSINRPVLPTTPGAGAAASPAQSSARTQSAPGVPRSSAPAPGGPQAPAGARMVGNKGFSIKDLDMVQKRIEPYTRLENISGQVQDLTQNPSGPGDVRLLSAFVEATKPQTGFRWTQQEVNLITGARSWQQAAEAKINQGFTGELFGEKGSEQRRIMSEIINKASEQAKMQKKRYMDAVKASNPALYEALQTSQTPAAPTGNVIKVSPEEMK